jgi:hypothetical protein
VEGESGREVLEKRAALINAAASLRPVPVALNQKALTSDHDPQSIKQNSVHKKTPRRSCSDELAGIKHN